MIDLRDVFKPPRFHGEIAVDLDDVEHTLQRRNVNMSPPYQRPVVWSERQKSLFMGHLLSGGETQPIIIQRVPDGGPQEVLDGKQRLTAILGWLHGEVTAELLDGTKIHINDLERGKCGTREVVLGLAMVNVRFRYINLPFEERKTFYIKLNSAGSPHTEADLEHARNAKDEFR